ncbi:MAG TPA: NapC/NirT family cytochrome c [Kofleriaceae bacterium]|nr:NapC/NirT family cytochrome c [Kofleriaceae bacterium]
MSGSHQIDIWGDPFLVLAMCTAGLSALVIVWFLVRKPQLSKMTKWALLFGIGILPIATAANGNIAGYHATKTTTFCSNGCHVMAPYGEDSLNPKSTSLASRHARNEAFGHENCYSCHADYGMFGTVTTKIGGMRHVYEYLTHYRKMPLEESLVKIELRNPFRNDACMRCHSTQNTLFQKVGDHASALDDVRSGKVSCASEGCHGFAHPFSKEARRKAGIVIGESEGGVAP